MLSLKSCEEGTNFSVRGIGSVAMLACPCIHGICYTSQLHGAFSLELTREQKIHLPPMEISSDGLYMCQDHFRHFYHLRLQPVLPLPLWASKCKLQPRCGTSWSCARKRIWWVVIRWQVITETGPLHTPLQLILFFIHGPLQIHLGVTHTTCGNTHHSLDKNWKMPWHYE